MPRYSNGREGGLKHRIVSVRIRLGAQNPLVTSRRTVGGRTQNTSMYAAPVRAKALALLHQGESLSAVARATGVARSTLRDWRDRKPSDRPANCPRCDQLPLDEEAYSALLGFYLGDGYIA